MKTILSIFALVFVNYSVAQQNNYSLNKDVEHKYVQAILKDTNQNFHSSVKPLNQHKFYKTGVEQVHFDSIRVFYWFTEKLYKKHLVEIKTPDFYCAIDPLFNFDMGGDLADTSGRGSWQDDGGLFHTNTRGIRVKGNLGNKFSFQSSIYENQAFFPDYMRIAFRQSGEYYWNGSKYKQQLAIVPGQGRAKSFKNSGFDYAFARGLISYAPNENWHLQFGNDKNFVGDGYRSILLSDAAFNYPFFKSTAYFLDNKIQVTNTFAFMQNLYRLPYFNTPEASFVKKNLNITTVSFIIGKKTELMLFEATVFQRYDSLSGTTPVNILNYNPVFGLNTIVNGLNGVHNSLLGLNARYNWSSNKMVYAQLMLDDLVNNKWGAQIGMRWYNWFSVPRTTAQFEYNYISPYAYSHANLWQSYTHFNQGLAHPYAAGIKEFVGFLKHETQKRFWFSYKLNLVTYYLNDGVGVGGSNFLESYSSSNVLSTQIEDLRTSEIRIGYKCNPKTNMNLYLGMTLRNQKNNFEHHKTTYVHIGFRTNLLNEYYDF